jgi:hypothetical protein
MKDGHVMSKFLKTLNQFLKDLFQYFLWNKRLCLTTMQDSRQLLLTVILVSNKWIILNSPFQSCSREAGISMPYYKVISSRQMIFTNLLYFSVKLQRGHPSTTQDRKKVKCRIQLESPTILYSRVKFDPIVVLPEYGSCDLWPCLVFLFLNSFVRHNLYPTLSPKH